MFYAFFYTEDLFVYSFTMTILDFWGGKQFSFLQTKESTKNFVLFYLRAGDAAWVQGVKHLGSGLS